MDLHEEHWEYVRTLLPPDIEESARSSGALIRARNVPDAAALLRVALAYAVSDASLKDTAAWACASEVARISGPALFYRMKESEAWLELLLGQILTNAPARAGVARPLRVVDATVINGPGKEAVQWRAHVWIEPSTGVFTRVELTGDSGGEKFGRHPMQPGELVLGDRAYATARGLHAVRQAGAHALVRFTPANLRTCDEAKNRIYLIDDESKVPAMGAVEWKILIPVPPEPTKSHKIWDSDRAVDWIPVRAIAARTRSGEVFWLLTTLGADELPAGRAMALYRLRWQIELLFKRLKSLLHLDALPSQEGPTAKSWILARLIAAALAQRLTPPSGPLSPWGYELPPANRCA